MPSSQRHEFQTVWLYLNYNGSFFISISPSLISDNSSPISSSPKSSSLKCRLWFLLALDLGLTSCWRFFTPSLSQFHSDSPFWLHSAFETALFFFNCPKYSFGTIKMKTPKAWLPKWSGAWWDVGVRNWRGTKRDGGGGEQEQKEHNIIPKQEEKIIILS